MSLKYILCRNNDPNIFTETKDELYRGVTIAVLDLLHEVAPVDIGQAYRTLNADYRVADLLILRSSSPNFPSIINSSGVLTDQPETKNIALLFPEVSNKRVTMTLKMLNGYYDLTKIRMEDLSDIEICSLVKATGSLFGTLSFDETDNGKAPLHYCLPSGQHASAFIHLQRCFNEEMPMKRIADWVIEFIQDASIIVADNGYMISLVLYIQNIMLEKVGKKIVFELINGYPKSNIKLFRTLIHIRAKHYGSLKKGGIAFIISVNSSGGFANKLKYFANKYSIKSSIIALVHTHQKLHNLDKVFSSLPITRVESDTSGDCGYCKKAHLAIIDRDSYEIMPKESLKKIPIDYRQANRNKELWQEVSDSNAVSLHVNKSYRFSTGNRIEERHHPVYINLTLLLTNENYRNRAKKKIISLFQDISFDLIVIPLDDHADAMRILLCEIWPAIAEKIIICTPDTLRNKISSNNIYHNVLILDDCSISGLSMRTFNEIFFQEYQKKGIEKPNIKGFVFIARPGDDHDLAQAKSIYFIDAQNHFSYLDLIYLPRSKNKCPWCEEQNTFATLANIADGQLKSSINLFTEKFNRPITNPLMLQALPNQKTIGSYFGELTYVAAAASTISLAEEIMVKTLEPNNSPFEKVYLDFADVLGKFHETIFPISLLRMLDYKHTRLFPYDKKLIDYIENRVTINSHPGFVSEFTLAALEGKLSLENVKHLVSKIKQINDSRNYSQEGDLIDFAYKLLELESQWKQ